MCCPSTWFLHWQSCCPPVPLSSLAAVLIPLAAVPSSFLIPSCDDAVRPFPKHTNHNGHLDSSSVTASPPLSQLVRVFRMGARGRDASLAPFSPLRSHGYTVRSGPWPHRGRLLSGPGRAGVDPRFPTFRASSCLLGQWVALVSSFSVAAQLSHHRELHSADDGAQLRRRAVAAMSSVHGGCENDSHSADRGDRGQDSVRLRPFPGHRCCLGIARVSMGALMGWRSMSLALVKRMMPALVIHVFCSCQRRWYQ